MEQTRKIHTIEETRRIQTVEPQSFRSTKRQFFLFLFIILLALLPLIFLGLYYAFSDPTCECGKVLISGSSEKVNNTEVKISYNGQWPWLAQLFKTPHNFTCDAIIISNRHLLTAAHCVEDKNVEKYFALVGGQRNWIKKQISMIAVHVDLAVLKLTENIEFNEFIQPICLPDWENYQFEENKKATIATYDHQKSVIKFMESLTLVNADCGMKKVCALNNALNSCLTHYGSPLFVKNEGTQQHTVIGISVKSNGVLTCKPTDDYVFYDLKGSKPWIYEAISQCDTNDCEKTCNIGNLKP